MIEFNSLTKQVVSFLKEMQSFGFSLSYRVDVDSHLTFETVKVVFSSSVVQSLVCCLLVDLARSKSNLSFFNGENLYIYCEDD